MDLANFNTPVRLVYLVCLLFGLSLGLNAGGTDIEIVASPVLLDEKNPIRKTLGTVTYAGGWALSSTDDYFGGFSGLVLKPEENKLVAVTDKGVWFTAQFDPLVNTPPTNSQLRPIVGLEDTEKILKDSESVIRWDDGFAVSFEFEHRIEWLPNIEAKAAPLPAAEKLDFAGWAPNGGAEAIVRLSDGKLLTFSERGKNVQGLLQVWLSDENSADRVFLKPPQNFAPTDAALLPNGDVLLLLRRFSAIDGVAAKVLHIKKADIFPGAILTGSEIMHLTPKLTVDNMEGLDVAVMSDDTVRLVMISDDNFIPLQRTLLLMFDYQYK